MCGIFGYVGAREEAPQLVLAGLKKLEYRGYDSWGIASRRNGAAQSGVAALAIEKHTGKIGQARTTLGASSLALGHTRWATHGSVTQANAHPHLDCGGRLALIHNGIVENHEELRRELRARDHTFQSGTDTEVVVHLLEEELARGGVEPDGQPTLDQGPDGSERLARALMAVFRRLEGLSAIAALDAATRAIAAAKNGSPLVLGWGEEGNFLASDPSALVEHTRRLTFLEDGQAAAIRSDEIAVYEVSSGQRIAQPPIMEVAWAEERADLDGHPDFMSKEVHEQPAVLRRLAAEQARKAAELGAMVAHAGDAHLVGCGTAANAAKVGEYLFSRIASQRVGFAVGSEFGYLADFLSSKSLVVGLSQSGETIDLLESMKAARRRRARLAALVNVEGSSLYRLVDYPVLLQAGPERCVLATKSFTAKVAVLLMAAHAAAGHPEQGPALVERAADEIQAFLTDGRAELMRQVAERFKDAEHLYVIGRGTSYPLALEAALKIKEVSYIHAEGFAGGELKHGVIALVEAGTPCLVLAPDDETFGAIVSGAQEIKARGGTIIGVSPRATEVWDVHVPLADVGEAAALVNAVPPQVLAYHLAILRGLDPDKPRNLAKSVTVK